MPRSSYDPQSRFWFPDHYVTKAAGCCGAGGLVDHPEPLGLGLDVLQLNYGYALDSGDNF